MMQRVLAALRCLFVVINVLLSIWSSTSPVAAAEMIITPSGEFYLVGTIGPGDFERFKTALRSAPPDLQTINLRSEGGQVVEALRIGRLIRSLYLDTGAPLSKEAGPYAAQNCSADPAPVRKKGPCTCASACFLIWAGGVTPFGDHVYLHRISFDKDYYGALTPAEAAVRYQEGLKIVRDYLTEMGVPDKYYERLVRTASSSTDKLKFLDVVNDFRWGGTPAFQEWLIARCGGGHHPDIKKRMRVQDCWFAEIAKVRKEALEKLKAE